MNLLLKQYFPTLKNRREILAEIHEKPALSYLFHSWEPEYQEHFLSFCSGTKGVPRSHPFF